MNVKKAIAAAFYALCIVLPGKQVICEASEKQLAADSSDYGQTQIYEYITEEQVDIPTLSEEEILLIARVTVAEAEGESEYGKRLVIDTVLNRVDSEHFPDTVTDVIFQPRQFSVMWNGRIERCEADDDTIRLVREELEERTDSDVIFFRESRYSDYGKPKFTEGSHYFSSYE
ncbi:MAG: cell wall hydrolase [Ruminococcus sp.]|nr:cell wall hydrolase [Ruminococcus sp.]